MSEASGSTSTRAERGRWLAAGAVAFAFVGAAFLLGLVLASLEYDFDDGTLAPFGPAWGVAVLVVYTVVAGVVLFSGVWWRRWAAVLGYAAGAAWVLFVGEFEAAVLPGVFAAAGSLGLAALLLTVSPSVQRFLAAHEASGGRVAQPLGPLASESDARRWIATIERWIDSGAVTPRERARLGQTLMAWVSSHPDSEERLSDDLKRVVAPRAGHRPLGWVRTHVRRVLRRKPTVS